MHLSRQTLYENKIFYTFNSLITSCAGTTYRSSAHLEWSPKDVIDLTLSSMYKYADNLMVRVNCELLTPFENWRRTSISGGYEIANPVQHHNPYFLPSDY
jgi:hypothetical protein